MLVGSATMAVGLRRFVFPVDYFGNQRVVVTKANRCLVDPILEPGLLTSEDVDVGLEVLHDLGGLPHLEWRQVSYR